jgi:hypothetical protein
MAAPKGNKFAVGNKGGGRHSQFNPKFIRWAELACRAGFTDRELAELFDVSLSAIEKWKRKREDFRNVLKEGKGSADRRVENSLYERATGYSYNAVKIFLPYGSREPVYAPYVEHMPPDTTAAIFWLKNRDPARWRDAWQLEQTGKYVVSDRTLTEDEWIKARGADVIDGEAVDQAEPKALTKN